MIYMKIEKNIEEFCKKENMIVGITNGEPKKSYNKEVPFVNYTSKERATPRLHLQDCQSIIVVGMPCFYEAEKPKDYQHGRFAMEAVARDYHLEIRDKLQALKEKLSRIVECKSEIYVDTGPMVERDLAVEAGLGYYGKNGSIISDEYGSFFQIGYMLTNLNLITSKPLEQKDVCGDCNLCIDACPGKALDNGFDYIKCTSFHTQNKDELTEEAMKKMGNWLYGCDICRLVCPYNKELVPVKVEQEAMYPRVEDIEALSNRLFREKYHERGFLWRGLRTLKRNVKITKNNMNYK